jgi:hypothetical protein
MIVHDDHAQRAAWFLVESPDIAGHARILQRTLRTTALIGRDPSRRYGSGTPGQRRARHAGGIEAAPGAALAAVRRESFEPATWPDVCPNVEAQESNGWW